MRGLSRGSRPLHADTTTAGGARPIAYVTTRYPSISHTFVLREVQALRARGLAIDTISIHAATNEHLISDENREALASTYSIRPPRWRDVLNAHARAAGRAPWAYVTTLSRALGLARPGLRGRLWQLFYFAEAIVLWRRCAAVDARHVHAHHGSPPADVALLAAEYGRRAGRGPASWSMTLHGPTEFWNTRWYRLPEKISSAAGVVCITDFARSQAMALVEERHWPKLEVVHCGLDPTQSALAAVTTPARAQILCVGRLVPEKGQAVLIRAFSRLREAERDIELVLVGDGPSAAGLRRLADELGVAPHVTFTGALGQDEIAGRYAAASMFCSSSFSEGLPVVLMEALACGCAVVATAIAGVSELIDDGESGLLVAPGRVDQLAQAMGRLLDDEELRTRLARNGRQRVIDDFDVRRSAAQLERFFARIASADRPAPARARTRAQSAGRGPLASDDAIADSQASVREGVSPAPIARESVAP